MSKEAPEEVLVAALDRERKYPLHEGRLYLLSAELIAGGIGADRSGSVRDGVRVAIKFAARSEAV